MVRLSQALMLAKVRVFWVVVEDADGPSALLMVKVVGGDNIDSAALPLPESSESSFSLGVDSSIELSPSLDERDVEMLAPREVKRAHTSGTSSDGAQDSRSESQQPKKPRPSSRGPKCVV
ncbi:hypothetical protein HPB52_010612 [Rhipicephalus sanguineus]|uniref:Uncharacterized protein n=1 Tax=Rhipicephalus sanguineus TaxID=34632 RepID=A0A9D4T3G3_RHISA|nr:hypothetical protein HPB52_010612 [Rhipicephalus sanguineus]